MSTARRQYPNHRKETQLHDGSLPRRPRARLSRVVPMSIAGFKQHSRIAVVVDDDPIVLEILSGMLEDFEWRVTSASSAEEALASDALPAAAVLVTDVNLGAGMDGFELYTIARHRWPDIGIVVISGQPPHPHQLRGLASRDIFVSKPLTMAALNAAIAYVCDQSGRGAVSHQRSVSLLR